MRRRRPSNNGSHLPAIPAESVADLMSRDPELYEKITDYLEKDGLSPNAISALLSIQGIRAHPDTIRRIRNLLPVEVRHSAIRAITSNMIETCQLLSARMVREADQIPTGQMASALGVLTDKIMLLVGEPSQRIEVSHTKTVSPEQLREMFNRLPKAADAREVTPSHPRP